MKEDRGSEDKDSREASPGSKRKAEQEKNKLENEAKRHQEEKKDESEKKEASEQKENEKESEKKAESEDETDSHVSCSTCASDTDWEEGQEEDSSDDKLPDFGREDLLYRSHM